MNYRLGFSPFVLLEIISSIVFILLFGFGNFLIFILFSMVFGALLLGIFWKNMLEFHISDLKNTLMQFAFVLAGFLFIIPGVITSILAFFILCFALIFHFSKKTKRNTNEEIIDVEIIEEKH